MTDSNLAAGILIVGGVIVLGWFVWLVLNRFWRRKSAVEERRTPPGALPQGAAPLALERVVWRYDHFARGKRLTLLLVGTYGVREGARIIDHFDRAGRVEDIGVVCVIELSEAQRGKFIAALPPQLARRTVFCGSTLLPGGLQGSPIEESESPELAQYWQADVAATVEEACRLIRGTEVAVFDEAGPAPQPGYDPAVILTVASAGGHLALGIFASGLLHDNFRLAHCYVVTNLSSDDQMRSEFPNGLVRYHDAGFVHWYMVSDDKRHPVANDFAVATFFAGVWVAPHVSDLSDDPWNTLVWLYARGFGGVVVPRFWGRMLPIQVSRSGRLFTFEEAAIRACIEGIAAIEAEDTKAAALPTPAPKTRRYVLITLPIFPECLPPIRDRVEEALTAKGWFAEDANRKLLWAVTAEVVTPGIRNMRMSVVAMEAAINGREHLTDLALGQLAPQLGLPSGNGSTTNGVGSARRRAGQQSK